MAMSRISKSVSSSDEQDMATDEEIARIIQDAIDECDARKLQDLLDSESSKSINRTEALSQSSSNDHLTDDEELALQLHHELNEQQVVAPPPAPPHRIGQRSPPNNPNKNQNPAARLPTIKFVPKAIVQNRSSRGEKEKCTVCAADYASGAILLILPCTHKFHKTCVSRWFKERLVCPECREPVKI